jgi:predicted nucleic acid-binding protein
MIGCAAKPKPSLRPNRPAWSYSWRDATRHSPSGPNFWTDAYLAAFATAAGYTVVTFDRGFKRHKAAKLNLLA